MSSKQTNAQKNRNRRLRKKAKRKNNKKTVQSSIVISQPHLSKCSTVYLQALVDTFNVRSLPCIPDVVTLPSFKWRTMARGNFTTGAAGFGYLLVDPFRLGFNNNAAGKNNYPIQYTGPAFVGVTTNSADADLFVADSASIFTAADFIGSERRFRLVGCGVRIQYSGSDFKNQGSVYLSRSQSNVSYPNGTGINDLTEDLYTQVAPVTRANKYVFYSPSSAEFNNYSDLQDYYTTNHYSLLIAIGGGDLTTPQSWLYEIVAYYEAIGPNLALSASGADPVGQGAIMSCLPTRNPVSSPPSVFRSCMNKIGKTISNVASGMTVNKVVKGIKIAGSIASAARGTSVPQIEGTDFSVEELPDDFYGED